MVKNGQVEGQGQVPKQEKDLELQCRVAKAWFLKNNIRGGNQTVSFDL